MRILSLKCTNLNSLRGEQPEIRFDRGPLAEAGLFAITGPTGTGKTTILDAITLALYGKVYRFEDDGSTLSADEVLAQLITLGTGRSEVEVTFRVEGCEYHSKWACNRARDKADGKVQAATMWLSRLTTDGGVESPYKTRTEVPKEVARLTQLDFGQFVRSVLLPQGAFAQFLRAKRGVRAELLQKLTNTESFARVGLAAHQRCQQAERALAVAEQTALLFANQILPPEELTRLAAEEADTTARLAAVNEQLAVAQAAVAWFRADQKWHQAIEAAEQECAESAAAVNAPQTAALRTGLARHRQAEPCREAWDAWHRAVGEVTRLDGHHAKLRTQTRPLSDAVQAASPAVSAAETAWQQARSAHLQQAPALRRAEALDVQHATAHTLLNEQAARVRTAEAAQNSQQTLLNKEEERLAAAQATYRRAHAWLNAHAAAAALTADALNAPRAAWHRAGLATQLLANLAQLDADAAQTRARYATDYALNQAHQTNVRSQQANAEAAEATCLHEAAQLWTQIGGHGLWLKAEHAAATAILDQLARHHRRLEALHVLPAYRHTLVAGEACALCGSPDHYPANVLTTSDGELAAARKALDTQAAAVEQLKNRIAALREAFVRARAGWPPERPEPPVGPLASYFLLAAETGLPDRINELKRQLREATAARQAAETQLASLAGAAQNYQTQQQTLTDQANRRKTERQAASEELTRETATVEAFFAQVGQPFVAATVEADLELLRQRGEAYQDHVRTRQTAEDTGKLAAERVGTLQTSLATATKTTTEERTRFEQGTTSAAGLLAERRALCPANVQPAAELTRLATAEERANETLDAARAAHTRATEAHRRHEDAVTLAAQTLAAANAACAKCEEDWQRQRTAHQLPADADLADWLIRDAARLDAQREELRALDDRCVAAEKARDLARQAHATHRTTPPPFADEAAALAADAELVATREALLVSTGARRERLEQHATAAAASRANATAFGQQQAETLRWQELRKLIGGADLKSTRFSQFAQSLTLAHLVREANRHLRPLSRQRYELVPKTDDDELGLWIIDADHAGTARAVESLSGGETFLVSLALALGLSDLAGYRVQIESLFIDEGFGTLDAETLDTAISALETVQQSGRMVGVISHVDALKERIKTQIQLRKVAGDSVLAVVVEK